MVTPKKRISKAMVKVVRRQLKLARKDGKTLRQLANGEQYFNGAISFQSLGAFIKDGKIPASYEVQETLGILAGPNEYRNIPKWWKRDPRSIVYRKEKLAQIRSMQDETNRQRKSYLGKEN